MLTIVHTENSCGWGGQELRTLTEMQGMLERGHHLTLVCPREAQIHDAALARGIPTTALAITRKKPSSIMALRSWLAGQGPIDILNCHSSTDSWLSALACATLRKAPVLVRTRHVSTPVANNWTSRWLYRSATRHIITTGEALRQQLHVDNGVPLAQMTSIPTGIDLTRFQPMNKAEARARLGLPADKHYLGILATLRNWKGHTYLLDAFAQLRDAFPDWNLLLVGDGPQRQNLERKAEALGLRQRITMPGNRDDVPIWLNAMDLFTLPSYGNEGVPQGIMQAMACGLSVISTPVGAIREAVIDNQTGLIVPPQNTEALSQALRTLMRDAALRSHFAQAGLNRARERFGSEVMLDKVEAVYAQVLAEHAG
ncbi:MAG: glycosyltransferase family 4 protein [Gammaproteobacteria bacterium]|nr:glycosyltransferase family 4 protein [Gammaproteobacteria bacterium]